MVTLNQIQCLVHESIGQKSVIGTGCSGNYRLSQGFIQPLYGRSTRKSTNQLKASIFPNPFTDVVTITFDEDIAENIQVTLLDMLGNTLQVNVYPKSQEIHLTPNSLNQGIYLLRIQSGGKLLTAKIIKE